MLSSTGEKIPILQTSFRVVDQDGETVRHGVVITDLRGIKRTEEKLRQSEAKYRALVESSPDAVIMTDLTGRVIFASREAAAWYGAEDPLEMTDRSVLEFVPETERDRLAKHVSRLAGEGVLKSVEYPCLRRDGSTYPAEASSSVIRDGTGEPVALMAVYRDITERKQAQKAIRREQEAATRLLQASDRDRKLITFEIHDGVAQRLAGALLHFQAISEQERGVSQQVRANFDAGLQALREAAAETRSLMNRTRTPTLDKFGVRTAIADLIDQFMGRANAPEITYLCEARFKRLEPVLENTIFRVAQEAITNACNHSKSEMVRVTLLQRGDELTLEVRDDGIGFDTSKVIQERFGLDGIRERTRLLGKDLKIESAPGKGTLIRATFPLIYPDQRLK
jgi:PAS domain S-box-containing protein